MEFRGHHTELLTRARSSGDGVRGHHTELLTRSSGRVSFPPWLDSGESGTPYPTLDAGLWPWEVKRDITKWHSICPKAYCIKHLRACPRGQCPHIRTISVRSLFPPQAVREHDHPDALPDRPRWAAADLPTVVVERVARGVPAGGSCVAVLTWCSERSRDLDVPVHRGIVSREAEVGVTMKQSSRSGDVGGAWLSR